MLERGVWNRIREGREPNLAPYQIETRRRRKKETFHDGMASQEEEASSPYIELSW